MTIPGAAWLERELRAFLKDLPTTAWVIVTGTVVGIMTAVVYLTAVLAEVHPEPVTFGIWCGFVASWIGFGVRQFRVKRETDGSLSPAAREVAAARLAGRPSGVTPAAADA